MGPRANCITHFYTLAAFGRVLIRVPPPLPHGLCRGELGYEPIAVTPLQTTLPSTTSLFLWSGKQRIAPILGRMGASHAPFPSFPELANRASCSSDEIDAESAVELLSRRLRLTGRPLRPAEDVRRLGIGRDCVRGGSLDFRQSVVVVTRAGACPSQVGFRRTNRPLRTTLRARGGRATLARRRKMA